MTQGRGKLNDLTSIDLRDLKWNTPEESAQSIQQLYDIVHDKAVSAQAWYMEKRRGRKWIAQWLRGLAALFAAAGILPPVLALVWPVPSELGYVMFVASGSCLLINRALGISSGWIRYVTTAFALTTALEEFQLDWAQTMAALAGRDLQPDDIQELIIKLKAFSLEINQLIETETATWAVQFNEELSRLEKMVQTKAQAFPTKKPAAKS